MTATAPSVTSPECSVPMPQTSIDDIQSAFLELHSLLFNTLGSLLKDAPSLNVNENAEFVHSRIQSLTDLIAACSSKIDSAFLTLQNSAYGAFCAEDVSRRIQALQTDEKVYLNGALAAKIVQLEKMTASLHALHRSSLNRLLGGHK